MDYDQLILIYKSIFANAIGNLVGEINKSVGFLLSQE